MIEHNFSQSAAPVPSIGVGGLLFNRQREVLLIKRDQAPAQGLWSIPGGKQEPGETLAETCRREFLEETNLVIETGSIVAVVERRLEGFHYVIIDFLVRLENENKAVPLARSDVAEAKWIALPDLANYDLVIGLAEIIKRACDSLENNWKDGLVDAYANGTDFILPGLTGKPV